MNMETMRDMQNAIRDKINQFLDLGYPLEPYKPADPMPPVSGD